MITPDDPFLVQDGEERISRAGFRAVIMARAASGVRTERDPGEYYDAILATRAEDGRFVDPLLMLAKFNHESSMGTAGAATVTRSWGNTRPPSFGVDEVGRHPQFIGGTLNGFFSIYSSWLDGCISTAGRLVTKDYVYAGWGRERIRHLYAWDDDPATDADESLVVWAPAGDFNNPSAYLRAVIDFMNANASTTGQEERAMPATPTSADLGFPTSTLLAHDVGPRRDISHVKWFICHKTMGRKAGDIPTLTRNDTNIASAHLWIGRDGECIFMVPLNVTAWTAGHDEVSRQAIQVEMEGLEHEEFTDQQYTALANFFRFCERQGMQVPREFVAYDDRPGIIGHMHVADPEEPGLWGGRSNHTHCPGPLFSFNRFLAEINTQGREPQRDPNIWQDDVTGQFVVNTPEAPLLAFFKRTGSLQTHGHPLEGVHLDADGVFRQWFENTLLESWPNGFGTNGGPYTRWGGAGQRYFDLRAEHSDLQAKFADLEPKHTTLVSEHDLIKAERDELLKDVKRLKRANAQLKEQVEALTG